MHEIIAFACFMLGTHVLPWSVPQERDGVISKLRSNVEHLSFKCEAATAQAEAAHPYEQRYRDLQVCIFTFDYLSFLRSLEHYITDMG